MKLYLKKIVSWGANKILEGFDFDWTLPDQQGEKVSQLRSYSCMVSSVFSVEKGDVDLSDVLTEKSDWVTRLTGIDNSRNVDLIDLDDTGKVNWRDWEAFIEQKIVEITPKIDALNTAINRVNSLKSQATPFAKTPRLDPAIQVKIRAIQAQIRAEERMLELAKSEFESHSDRLKTTILTLAARAHLGKEISKGPADYNGPLKSQLQYVEVCGDWEWTPESTDYRQVKEAVKRKVPEFRTERNNFEILRKVCLFKEFGPVTLRNLIGLFKPKEKENLDNCKRFAWEMGNTNMIEAFKLLRKENEASQEVWPDRCVELAAQNRHHHLISEAEISTTDWVKINYVLTDNFVTNPEKERPGYKAVMLMKALNSIFIGEQLNRSFNCPKYPDQFAEVCGDYSAQKVFPEDVKVAPFNILRKTCLLKGLSEVLVEDIVKRLLPLIEEVEDQQRCLRFACEVGNGVMLKMLLKYGVSPEHESCATSPIIYATRQPRSLVKKELETWFSTRYVKCKSVKSLAVYQHLFGLRRGEKFNGNLQEDIKTMRTKVSSMSDDRMALFCESVLSRSKEVGGGDHLQRLTKFMQENWNNPIVIREQLSFACEVGNLDVVKGILTFYDSVPGSSDFQIKANTRLSILNDADDKESPLSMAAMFGHEAVVDVLMGFGAKVGVLHLANALLYGQGRSASIEKRFVEKILDEVVARKMPVHKNDASQILHLFIKKIESFEKRGVEDLSIQETFLIFAFANLDAFIETVELPGPPPSDRPSQRPSPFHRLVSQTGSVVLKKYFVEFVKKKVGESKHTLSNLLASKILKKKDLNALKDLLSFLIQGGDGTPIESDAYIKVLKTMNDLIGIFGKGKWKEGEAKVEVEKNKLLQRFNKSTKSFSQVPQQQSVSGPGYSQANFVPPGTRMSPRQSVRGSGYSQANFVPPGTRMSPQQSVSGSGYSQANFVPPGTRMSSQQSVSGSGYSQANFVPPGTRMSSQQRVSGSGYSQASFVPPGTQMSSQQRVSGDWSGASQASFVPPVTQMSSQQSGHWSGYGQATFVPPAKPVPQQQSGHLSVHGQANFVTPGTQRPPQQPSASSKKGHTNLPSFEDIFGSTSTKRLKRS